MIHYTCDRCKRAINTSHQTRYTVQIDIQPCDDLDESCGEDDIDQLSELNHMLTQIEDDFDSESPATQHRGQYDLCPTCHRQFLENPLGRDAALPLGFSDN